MASSSCSSRAAFLGLLGALPAVGVPALAQSPAPLAVRVIGSANDAATAVVFGARSGLFARNGLDVTVEKANNGAAAAAAVASGAFAIGKSSITSIFSAHENGVPFTIIAAGQSYDSREPDGGMLFLKTSSIVTGKDLNGQTVGVNSLSSITRLGMSAWIEATGGDLSTVKMVEIPYSAAMAALEQKRVVALEIGEPDQSSILATGKFGYIKVDDAIARTYTDTVYYTTKEFANQHPQAIATFVRVLYEAARYCNAHPEATTKMMAEFVGMQPDVFATMPRAKMATSLDLAGIQLPIDVAARYGLLKKTFPARDLIDTHITVR